MITERKASAPTGSSAHHESTRPLVATQPPSSSETRIRKPRLIHMMIIWIMLFGRIWLTGPLLDRPETASALFAIVVRLRQSTVATAPR